MSFSQQKVKLALIAAVSSLTLACAPIRHSPFAEQTQSKTSSINSNSLGQVMELKERTETLRIGIFADSHANYDDLENTLKVFNSTPLNFIVNLGDMTDLGLAIEYDLFLSIMESLRLPWFSVIGNHDSVGNGELIYKNHFGEYNYFFDLSGYRFIFFNNNQLDFLTEGIDYNWLDSQIQNSPFPVILFHHVDPENKEYFTEEIRNRYASIVSTGKVAQIFHGHKHSFSTYTVAGVPVQGVARTENSQYSILEISVDQIKIFNYSGDQYEIIENSLQHLRQ